jgi:hypothetical protein
MWFFKTLFCSDIDVPNIENKINELEATNNPSDNPSAQVVDVPSDNPSAQLQMVDFSTPRTPCTYNNEADFHNLKHSPSTEHITDAFMDSLSSTDMGPSSSQQNPITYTSIKSILGTVGPTEGTFEPHPDDYTDTSTESTSYAERTHEHDITSDDEYTTFEYYNEGYYDEEVDPDIIRQAQEEVSRMLVESKLNK